jgi:outer membrane protein TolC
VKKVELGAVVVLALIGGCKSHVDPRADYEAAREGVAAATGVSGARLPGEALVSATEIESILDGGLTLEEARSLALRNSAQLQIAFLDVGIARADVEQSKLLRNPTLGFAYLWPDGGGRDRIGGELVQGLGELWQIRFREELANADLRAKVAAVAQVASRLLLEVERAFLDHASASESIAVADDELELAAVVLGLAEKRVAHGMAPSTEVSLARSRVAAAEFERTRLEGELIAARGRIALALSIGGDPARIEPVLPVSFQSGEAPELAELLTRATAQRLDLRAAELAVARAETAVALERRRALPEVSAGLEAEHPEVGTNTPFVGGFNGSIELPIFDDGSVQVRRAELARELAAEERALLQAGAEQEVRTAHAALLAARSTLAIATSRTVPEAERALALSRTAYEMGRLTILDVLAAEAQLVAARADVASARATLALARHELVRVTGGAL